MIKLAISWACLLGLWLVFVFQVSVSELVAGAVLSAMTVFAGWVTFRTIPLCFEPKFKWIVQMWRIPGEVAADLPLLVTHLLRELAHKPSQSRFRTVSLRAAGENCRVSSQRALATLLVSITPNAIVLAINHQTGEMLVHELEPTSSPAVLDALGD